MGLTGLHLLIIVGVVVLLFGATRLPALAKGLGASLRILKQESRADDHAEVTPRDEDGA
ncbi:MULTISPECIES: twin-arginine translocase TatA/TatE family subunit [unclassified Curtobacterium]|uniref:twin-arginine translocase TatA/TatE family subunit n=1 Tax=unclassified Curtobacterium TaxID=257496 RepID=UPI0021ABD357|nr:MULTISPECIES: twin-arginine translocase TatA/TatE family subunit [unclassified Curtobacterium]WIB65211.1 twin-arginine translocase TatA/TatE family subunit [Curtobacterium sp. MCBD17_040]WIB69085.1 twin-arginine translocase TatA/TatE family subunit [Curtobacterium sp. MCBD17_035]WIE56246.1 twin-arginine translocase TatA/TatE family subunit [Curtobacterium sp. MCBD17_003]